MGNLFGKDKKKDGAGSKPVTAKNTSKITAQDRAELVCGLRAFSHFL